MGHRLGRESIISMSPKAEHPIIAIGQHSYAAQLSAYVAMNRDLNAQAAKIEEDKKKVSKDILEILELMQSEWVPSYPGEPVPVYEMVVDGQRAHMDIAVTTQTRIDQQKLLQNGVTVDVIEKSKSSSDSKPWPRVVWLKKDPE